MENDSNDLSSCSRSVPSGSGYEKTTPHVNRTKTVILISMAIFVITFAVYWQVRSLPFIDFDDADYVTANPRVATGIKASNIIWAFTSVHSSNWHPLTWLSLMADAQLYGMAAGGYHLTNVIIHALSAILLFLLLFRMTQGIWQSSFVAALFAFHPLHVESVAWIAERKDVLSAFFCFLTLYFYAAYVADRKKSLYLLTLFSFILGLMSKPMLVTLPLLMLLLDIWPLQRLDGQKQGLHRLVGDGVSFMSLLKEKIPFFALSGLSSLITVYAQHMGKAMNKVSFTLGIENAILAFVRYLAKMLWPQNLAIFYPFPDAIPLWQALSSLIVLVLVSLATIWSVRRKPYLMVGWFWYLVTLVPVIGLIPVGAQSIADRYTYLPLIGIFIMIGWGIPDLLRNLPYRKGILAFLVYGWLTVLMVLTWQQLGFWRDSITLFRHSLQLSPNSHVAHTMMGNALSNKGEVAEAIKEYQEALAINPEYPQARRNWAIIYFKRGNDLTNREDLDGAIKEYQEAIKIDATFIEARKNLAVLHTNLGNALSNKGDLDAAIQQYRESLSIVPNYSGAHNDLGIALAKKGDLNAAIKEFQAALAIDPNSSDARNNLDFALSKRGVR